MQFDIKDDPLGALKQKLAEVPWLNVVSTTKFGLSQITISKSAGRGFDVILEDCGDEWTLQLGPFHCHFSKPNQARAAFDIAMDGIFGYSYVIVFPGKWVTKLLLRTKEGKRWVTAQGLTTIGRGYRGQRKMAFYRNKHRYE